MRLSAMALPLMIATVAAASGERKLVEGIVVRVNDRILTTADIRQRANEQMAQTGKPVPLDEYPEFIQEAADELCMLERAGELKLEVSNEELNGAIQELKEQNHVQDDISFEKALRDMGMTLDTLRARIHDNMLVNHLLKKEVGDLPITQEELRQRFEREKDQFAIGERVHLEHIVFSVGADAAEEESRRAAARRLVAAVRSGSDFKTLVQREVAAGQGTGGDLGTVLAADMRAEVREVVARLKPGEISDPFTSSAGLHVVHLLERIPPTVKPFNDVEPELRQRELSDRYRSHLSSVVTDLKKRYVVEVHPEMMTSNK